MRYRQRWERASRQRRLAEPTQRPQDLVANANVLIAGLFSARFKDHAQLMDALAAEVTSRGGRVVGRFVQRRGISGGKKGNAPGGKANMDRPYSARTLMSTGKVHEIAQARTVTGADAVVFFNELTSRQRNVLTEIIGCPALSRYDLQPSEPPTKPSAEHGPAPTN